jgi:hypothetical protein
MIWRSRARLPSVNTRLKPYILFLTTCYRVTHPVAPYGRGLYSVGLSLRIDGMAFPRPYLPPNTYIVVLLRMLRMSSLMEAIAETASVFQDTISELQIDFESTPYYLRRGRRGGLIKSHARRIIRERPRHKGLAIHTKSEHQSHGYGSFCRTHSHPTCR